MPKSTKGHIVLTYNGYQGHRKLCQVMWQMFAFQTETTESHLKQTIQWK